MKDVLSAATRSRHALSSPTSTRTIVGDIGRKPDRQHGLNSRAEKLEAVGHHDGIADGHVRTRPELGRFEAAERSKLVNHM